MLRFPHLTTWKREDLSGYLTLDQTTPQDIINGQPDFLAGLRAGSTNQLSIDASGNLTTTGTITGGTLTDGTFSVTAGAITGASGSNSMWTNDEGYLTTVAFADLSDYPADAAGVLTNDGAGNLSWGAGGGGGVSFGTTTQIPYMNVAGDDFLYSSKLVFDGSYLSLKSDNSKIKFGNAGDASIYYDGSDLVIDSHEVGTGYTKFPDSGIQLTKTGFVGVKINSLASTNKSTVVDFIPDTNHKSVGFRAMPKGTPTYDAWGHNNVGASFQVWESDYNTDSTNWARLVFGAGDDGYFILSNNAGTRTRKDILLGGFTGTTLIRSLVISTTIPRHVTVNPDAGDMDFIVQGDTDTTLIVADAGLDKVGIGKASPSEKLDVNGTIKATAYKSSDGSAGISTTFLDNDGNTITVKDGLITAKTAP
jgi:hypothetical protein